MFLRFSKQALTPAAACLLHSDHQEDLTKSSVIAHQSPRLNYFCCALGQSHCPSALTKHDNMCLEASTIMSPHGLL